MAFVQIEAQEGYSFEDLVDSGQKAEEDYSGAWANLIVKADTINEALTIIPQGLKEKNFEILLIDKIENVQSLVEYNEIGSKVIEEIDWLLATNYVFLISDKIFTYIK